jgi:phage gp16-like protein
LNPLAAIHVKKKALGLDDDTYRALLERVTGKRSAGDMSLAEQLQVVSEMNRQGAAAAPAAKASRRGLEGPFAKKLQALWIAGWNLGLIRNRDDAALTAFVERMTGISSTRFLVDAADGRQAIEALKKWLEREGGVDWSVGDHMSAVQRLPGFMIARAQWARLHPGERFDTGGFRAFCEDHAFNPLPRMTAAEWQGVMNRLGEQIRTAAR